MSILILIIILLHSYKNYLSCIAIKDRICKFLLALITKIFAVSNVSLTLGSIRLAINLKTSFFHF